MKRYLIYIILTFAALLSGCARYELDEPYTKSGKKTKDGFVTLNFGVSYAGERAVQAGTKSFGDVPEIDHLYLAVFGPEGYLEAYVPATRYSVTERTGADHLNHTAYTAELPIIEGAATIHFIANGPTSLNYGKATRSIGELYTSGTDDAYWQMVSLEAGTLTEEGINSYKANALKEVALIRNFAKVTITADDPVNSNFILESAYITNNADRGSIAPYNTERGEFVSDYIDYKDTEELIAATHYDGFIPTGVVLNSKTPTETDFREVNFDGAAWDFLYERETPSRGNIPVYIIVKGSFCENGNPVGAPCYYKVELRKQTGEYFPILRNFNYKINILKVQSRGAADIESAMNMSASGDVSTSLENQGLINIANDESRIFVSTTDVTVVDTNPFEIKYKFIPDFKANPDTPANQGTDTTIDYTQVFEGEGDAISSISIAGADDPSDGYRVITVIPEAPGSTPKHQSITIIGHKIKEGGKELTIERKVNVTVRQILDLIVKCDPEQVSKVVGSPVDYIIEIPSGLPKMMFPLQFLIEAENLTIMPNNDNLPVITGKTIINPQQNPYKTAFRFSKEVSFDEYSSAPAVLEGEDQVQYRCITCHFKTNAERSATVIHTSNYYSRPASAQFTNFDADEFSNLTYKVNDVATYGPLYLDTKVNFSFDMNTRLTGSEKILVTLDGFQPQDINNTLLEYVGMKDGKTQWTYPQPNNLTGINFDLISTAVDKTGSVTLDAYHHTQASSSIALEGLKFRNVEINGSNQLKFDLDQIPSNEFVTLRLTGFSATGLTPSEDGTFKFYPSGTGTQTVQLSPTLSSGIGGVTISGRGYSDANAVKKLSASKTVTVNRDVIFKNEENPNGDEAPFGRSYENSQFSGNFPKSSTVGFYLSSDPRVQSGSQNGITLTRNGSGGWFSSYTYAYDTSSSSTITVDYDAKYVFFLYTIGGVTYHASAEIPDNNIITGTVYFKGPGSLADCHFKNLTIRSGSTKTLAPDVDYTGVPEGADIELVSGDESIVSVSNNQLVAHAANEKKVVFVTANVEGQGSYTFRVTVEPKNEGTLAFMEDEVSVAVGETVTNAVIANNSGTVSYRSEDTSHATVDSNTGVVTGVSVTSSPVIITATTSGNDDYSSVSQTFRVNVVPGDPDLTVNYDDLVITRGARRSISVGFQKNFSATSSTGGNVHFMFMDQGTTEYASSSNVISIGGGKITANHIGATTVKVIVDATHDYNRKEMTFIVQVTKKRRKIVMASDLVNVLAMGNTADVAASILDEDDNPVALGQNEHLAISYPAADVDYVASVAKSGSETNLRVTSDKGSPSTIRVKVSLEESDDYTAASTTFDVKVNKIPTSVGLTETLTIYNKAGVNNHATSATIAAPSAGIKSVSYAADNNNCTINGSTVSAKTDITADANSVITATYTLTNSDYYAAPENTTCAVTVKKVHWVYVTASSDLINNDNVMIVNSGLTYALNNTGNDNNGASSTAFSNNNPFDDTQTYTGYQFYVTKNGNTLNFKHKSGNTTYGLGIYRQNGSTYRIRVASTSAYVNDTFTPAFSGNTVSLMWRENNNTRYVSVGSSVSATTSTTKSLSLLKYE